MLFIYVYGKIFSRLLSGTKLGDSSKENVEMYKCLLV